MFDPESRGKVRLDNGIYDDERLRIETTYNGESFDREKTMTADKSPAVITMNFSRRVERRRQRVFPPSLHSFGMNF